MSHLKVLLVEDHPAIRRGLALLLSQAGFHVTEAATVADAIAKVDGQAFALLDLHLPDGEGTAVLAAIRHHAPGTRVAFLTAAFDPDREIETSGHRADAVFRKPADMCRVVEWLQASGVVRLQASEGPTVAG